MHCILRSFNIIIYVWKSTDEHKEKVTTTTTTKPTQHWKLRKFPLTELSECCRFRFSARQLHSHIQSIFDFEIGCNSTSYLYAVHAIDLILVEKKDCIQNCNHWNCWHETVKRRSQNAERKGVDQSNWEDDCMCSHFKIDSSFSLFLLFLLLYLFTSSSFSMFMFICMMSILYLIIRLGE